MTIAIISNRRWPTPRALAEALTARHIRLNRPFVNRRRPDVLVNWGCSDLENYRDWARGAQIQNPPAAVALCTSKLRTFQRLQQDEVPILEYTTDHNVARGWMTGRNAKSVVGHFNPGAHSGQGLRVFRREEPARATTADFTNCRLFTQFIPRDREFRAHVFKQADGSYATFINEKRRAGRERQQADFGREAADYYVRNHQTGWVYVRDVAAADAGRVSAIAAEAAESLGLSFGAVDVFWTNGRRGGAPDLRICEANSAPGLTGAALEFYVNQINALHNRTARRAA